MNKNGCEELHLPDKNLGKFYPNMRKGLIELWTYFWINNLLNGSCYQDHCLNFNLGNAMNPN